MGFRRPFFSINEKHADNQSWSNSATWCFNFYITQDKDCIDVLKFIINRKFSYDKAKLILQSFSNRRKNPILIDDWAEGMVNVKEIVDSFKE